MTREELKNKIRKFIERAIAHDSQAIIDILGNDRIYNGFQINMSFGAGQFASKPWFAFLKDDNVVQNGIYPIISYFYDEKILVIGKGVSDANAPERQWIRKNNDNDWQELPANIRACHNCTYRKYYENINSIDDLTDEILEEIIDIIDELIQDYYLSVDNEQESIENNVKNNKNNFNIKNIILYGSPGVGKTHSYQKLISMIEDGKNQKEIFDTIKNSSPIEQNNEIYQKVKNEKRVEFVTFHQSYSYEDFIEGFRPNEDGSIKLEDGIFKKLCQEAGKNKEQNYYIIIDEINRGNISKIFGELITLIEEDKRDRLEVTLPYSKEPFKIPSNLYIIATMNTTDKSIATIDIALRRRFTFIKMSPNPELITKNLKAKTLMIKLNEYIKENLSEDYMLGHSYFMKVEKDEDLEFVKEYKLKPLLEEYFYADSEKLKEVMEKLN